MSGFGVSFELAGLKEFEAELKAVEKNVKKELRSGVTKASRVVKAAVKQRMPKESGLARRRLDFVVRTYNAAIIGIIGIKKESKLPVTLKDVYRFMGDARTRVRIDEPRSKQMDRNPAKYLHFLELGWIGADGRKFPAVAPIRRGHEAKQAEAQGIIEEHFRKGVEGAKK